ncbi:hypothetical protein MMYC01_200132 [Madurella mycetomatis]|uniref:Uncharacterized protein n=1 Tax=Madurella mycetomatis TaxID=100816 RepID=A0A150ASH3_9PEZI|nr:hypothetical protein MMYC01_200132 [Madurella mycetomatis]
MVGGRQVLLCFAVLSSLGLETVLGGRLRRQDGAINSLQTGPGNSSTSTTSRASQADAVVSLPEPTATVTGTAPPTSEALAGGSSGAEETSPGLGPAAVSSGVVRPTSTGDDYVYPGLFGSGGSLTTDSNAPTRTVVPTKVSVAPNPGTEKEPPPVETIGAGSPPPPAAPPATTGEQTGPRGSPSSGRPPRPTTTELIGSTTRTVDLGDDPSPSGRGPLTFLTFTRPQNQTWTYGPSNSASYCQSSDLTAPPTSWSIVYTSTITWYGNPEDYTPAYPTISIPSPTPSCIVPPDVPRLTISVCTSTGTGTKYVTCDVTTTTESWSYGIKTTPVPVVFITTDKNPAVVYSTIRTPDYGISRPATTRDHHVKPTQAGGISTPAYDSQSPAQGMSSPGPGHQSAITPVPPITVGVQPSAVVIDGNTISDNPTAKTQVVVISSQTFTINPTQIIGAGTTIDRPSATGGVFAPTPTSTNLAGLPVVISSSIAVVAGSTFTLSPTATIATISGQTVTIGPSTIAVSSQTMSLPTHPSPTEVVVAGGEVITAVGPSVVIVHGTTLTYETSLSTSSFITIDDDVITLGPGGGVTAHGTLTLGGPGAKAGETEFAVVGGATITKIGASVVVIKEVTYTVGPSADAITTVVGGETVAVGPDGVIVGGTMTMAYPFGPTMVITPTPGKELAVPRLALLVAVTAVTMGRRTVPGA